MQFFNNAFAAVIIAVAGDVWSPRVVSALHISAGDGGDSRHDGLENGIRVSNYLKKAERDDCIFGGVLSFCSFFLFFLRWRRSTAFSPLVLSVVLVGSLVREDLSQLCFATSA